jgi:hypothetical protein
LIAHRLRKMAWGRGLMSEKARDTDCGSIGPQAATSVTLTAVTLHLTLTAIKAVSISLSTLRIEEEDENRGYDQ